jgi:predicted DNA-binding transcriptional regulator AlpA
MERAGISLKRMAEMTGYDKTTLWHAINDGKYRQRLSRKFWGKIGATIRWKVKPLVSSFRWRRRASSPSAAPTAKPSFG